MRLLVTGGAGYIGSVVAAMLADAGHEVDVLDDLSTRHAGAVPAGPTLILGTRRDPAQKGLARGADGARGIVFSSTAAVYGEPERVPIDETAPTRPTNPYGASKLAVDTALAEHARMHGIGAVSLRYFNVAGAHPGPAGGWLGERHDPETHLIPNVLAIALADSGPGAHASIY